MAFTDYNKKEYNPSSIILSKNTYILGGKRCFDVALVSMLLPVILPVVLIFWLIVRSDGGPGLFGHTRIGKDGRKFRCWKLRSMIPDAEAALREYLAQNPAAAEEWERNRKLVNDPRITPVGRFLRKTSLDELPQLWNVLRGDMSFVGPRPVPADELANYGRHIQAYLAVRPGITGIWQVSGRNNVQYSTRVMMDVLYLQKMAFWFDLQLILRTAIVIVRPTGS